MGFGWFIEARPHTAPETFQREVGQVLNCPCLDFYFFILHCKRMEEKFSHGEKTYIVDNTIPIIIINVNSEIKCIAI